jgi:Cu/Ag efflux protein CusF
MRGTVMGVDVSGHTATIKHDDIEGFMKAMTMGYPVKDTAELGNLSVGEPITATVYVDGDDFWVGNIKRDANAKP